MYLFVQHMFIHPNSVRNCLLLHNTVFIATLSDVNILQNWGWGIFFPVHLFLVELWVWSLTQVFKRFTVIWRTLRIYF